jgi:hypothetical protein
MQLHRPPTAEGLVLLPLFLLGCTTDNPKIKGGNGWKNYLTIFNHISFYSVTKMGKSEMEYGRQNPVY